MNTLQNIKAKECCCGCTLRTGSLILFWTFLGFEALLTLIYLTELTFVNKLRDYHNSHYSIDEDYHSLFFLNCRSSYYLCASIAGLTSCLCGIYGIQKNASKYLNFGLYYIGYNVVFCIVSAILLIAAPNWHSKLIMNGGRYNSYGNIELVFLGEVAHLFALATLLYFFVIVRSCRDSMVKNNANGRTGEIPDPSAYGYASA